MAPLCSATGTSGTGRIWLLLALLLGSLHSGLGQEAGEGSDLASLTLEELMDVQLTSVLRKGESLGETPAPVTVITAEQIRRSGATELPELLRLVPGVAVARIDSHTWAISARGFNGRNAGKLLVLVDGRSIYTPLFSGVQWETQDLVLEDIERIEVIRGPGGTLWGANAVNGIINIVTKPARQTQGKSLAAILGNEDPYNAVARFGGSLDGGGAYRVYGKAVRRDGLVREDGKEAKDDWDAWRAGFRADWKAGRGDDWTVLGEGSRGSTGLWAAPPLPDGSVLPLPGLEGHFHTAFLVGRWLRRASPGNEIQIQGSLDFFERTDGFIGEKYQAANLDFQQSFQAGNHHRLVWGLGARWASDRAWYASSVFGDSAFLPEKRLMPLWSAYLQDQWSLGNLNLFLGTKLEHNRYTGLEIQPSLRASWLASPRFTLWAGVSRGLRTPSRITSDTSIRNTLPSQMPKATIVTEMRGNPDSPAEELVACETGLRWNPGAAFSFDLALFVNRYDNLATVDPLPPEIEFTPQGMVITTRMRTLSGAEAETKGGEAGLLWAPDPSWSLRGGASYLQSEVTLQPGSEDNYITAGYSGGDPRWQGFLTGSFDLGKKWELDATLRRVGRIPGEDKGPGSLSESGVPAYTEADLRLAWKPRPGLEVAFLGMNLLQADHPEFIDSALFALPTRVQRRLALKFTWSF